MAATRFGSKGLSSVWLTSTLVIIVLLGSAWILLTPYLSPPSSSSSSSSSSSLTLPASITVFGLVSTTGEGTRPTSMVFTSFRNGQSFVAPVSEGRFSVQLPNHDTYNVTTRWSGNYSWQTGQVARGQLPLNISAGSQEAQSYNVVEITPNSMITVGGSLIWQISSSNPAAIKFTAGDGEAFVAGVYNKTFSIHLPNMMSYQLDIQSQNATGNSEWYYAHQLEVEAGPKVIGLTVRIPL